MMDMPLLISSFMQHAARHFPTTEIVSRRLEGDIHRYSYRDAEARMRQLASALELRGIAMGERVGTLAWNGYRHLEVYYAVGGKGSVVHTINPRLHPDQIAWIANDAKDRFLIVDDVLLPLLAQFQSQCAFEKIIVFPFSGAPVPAPYLDYEALLAQADGDKFQYAAHHEDDAVS
ncbi:MAG: fatty acid--CoA ligase, partial [Betaproteobacteria bacterium]|nr:fatty acid--CoA ligase [Betaproteobacteria bacterium]